MNKKKRKTGVQSDIWQQHLAKRRKEGEDAAVAAAATVAAANAAPAPVASSFSHENFSEKDILSVILYLSTLQGIQNVANSCATEMGHALHSLVEACQVDAAPALQGDPASGILTKGALLSAVRENGGVGGPVTVQVLSVDGDLSAPAGVEQFRVVISDGEFSCDAVCFPQHAPVLLAAGPLGLITAALTWVARGSFVLLEGVAEAALQHPGAQLGSPTPFVTGGSGAGGGGGGSGGDGGGGGGDAEPYVIDGIPSNHPTGQYVPRYECFGQCNNAEITDRYGYATSSDIAQTSGGQCVLIRHPVPEFMTNGIHNAARGTKRALTWTANCDRGPTPREQRYALYYNYASSVYMAAGDGNRVELPLCIVYAVRQKYFNPKGTAYCTYV